MASTTEIREALASGRAVLSLIVTDEAWYFPTAVQPFRQEGILREFSVSVDAVGDGTFGEWTIAFKDLGGPVAQHRIYGDAIPALMAVPGYWEALDGCGTPEEVYEALTGLGFQDRTDRTSPYAEEVH